MSRVLSESVTYSIETAQGFIRNKRCVCDDGSTFSSVDLEFSRSCLVKDATRFSSLEEAHAAFLELRQNMIEDAIEAQEDVATLTVLHIYEERTVLRTPDDELDLILQEFNK